ncbi:uncharacterized protein LOC110434766 [Sorghum bicolor]|uniref:uncharacterized protein LOC110434766 n=1 Tax=Sorghum bicolor TaxID=4558 RepID=UPI000B426CB4|nr:uncharacterized protein LOC110434766 [Sorghum bicolor]|eukprot:XP_021315166.1 uncharacterized protein LOC110434766 [Sorghum bicolor]
MASHLDRILEGTSDSRPPADAESELPRTEPAPSPPTRVEAPQTQEQEGGPEPPRLGVEADPITISDTFGGNETSGDAHPMEEDASTSLIAGRTPWLAGLRALEEQKMKEEEDEERECEATRQPQEQGRGQEPQEHEEQQQQ